MLSLSQFGPDDKAVSPHFLRHAHASHTLERDRPGLDAGEVRLTRRDPFLDARDLRQQRVASDLIR